MLLRFHSSGCCGIKVLCGFPYHLDATVQETEELSEWMDVDQDEYHFSGEVFQNEVYPAEPARDRLDRLLKFLTDERPGTLCEATIGGSGHDGWRGVLEEKGFKVVNEFWNQCSENMVWVMHWRVPVDESKLDDSCDCEDCAAERASRF